MDYSLTDAFFLFRKNLLEVTSQSFNEEYSEIARKGGVYGDSAEEATIGVISQALELTAGQLKERDNEA